MNNPPAQPNLPPAATLTAGIVPSVWDYANAVCAHPCTFNGRIVNRHIIFFIIKTDVLSVRLIPTLLLSKDVLSEAKCVFNIVLFPGTWNAAHEQVPHLLHKHISIEVLQTCTKSD